MSTILKCDLTGKADVPTFKVTSNTNDVLDTATSISGERLKYVICIENQNGYSAIDVAQEYVYEELIKNLTQKLNELKNPAVNQTKET